MIRRGSVVVMTVPLVFGVTLVMAVTVMSMVLVVIAIYLPVARYVYVVVPVVTDKVDRPTAGVVGRTMLAPVLLMTRRNVQIDRRGHHDHRRRLNHHRMRVHQLRRWKIADSDLAVEAR